MKTAARLCREHQLQASMLSRWKTQFLKRATTHDATRQADQQRIAELERLVGRLTRELEVTKILDAISRATTDHYQSLGAHE